MEVISFGFGHAPAPRAHVVIDVRDHFRDPHVRPALRQLTGKDAAVIEAVLGTPGIRSLIRDITSMARAFLAGSVAAPVVIAVGCAGGRHRSAIIAEETTRELRAAGVAAAVTHRDISRPVIARQAGGGRDVGV